MLQAISKIVEVCVYWRADVGRSGNGLACEPTGLRHVLVTIWPEVSRMSDAAADIVEELLDAADGLSALSRSALEGLLRRAALDIHDLRSELAERQPAPGKSTKVIQAA